MLDLMELFVCTQHVLCKYSKTISRYFGEFRLFGIRFGVHFTQMLRFTWVLVRCIRIHLFYSL